MGCRLDGVGCHSELQSVDRLGQAVFGLVHRTNDHSLGPAYQAGLQDSGQPGIPKVNIAVFFAESPDYN